MKLKNSQKGFTLVEMLLVLAMGGLLLSGVVTAIFQTTRITMQSSPQITALENIKGMARSLTTDAKMAATSDLVNGAPALDHVALRWTVWYDENNKLNPREYYVEYTLSEGKVVRNYGVLGTADSGAINTLTDNALTQTDDYWNGYSLKIVNTTDGLAPKGQTRQVTDFVASTDTLYTESFSATIGAGDTYWLYSTTTAGKYISDIGFSLQAPILIVTITSSPDGRAETAENRTYQFYLKPKEDLVQ